MCGAAEAGFLPLSPGPAGAHPSLERSGVGQKSGTYVVAGNGTYVITTPGTVEYVLGAGLRKKRPFYFSPLHAPLSDFAHARCPRKGASRVHSRSMGVLTMARVLHFRSMTKYTIVRMYGMHKTEALVFERSFEMCENQRRSKQQHRRRSSSQITRAVM